MEPIYSGIAPGGNHFPFSRPNLFGASQIQPLVGLVHDDVGGVDVEMFIVGGDALAVALEHAQRPDRAQVVQVDVLNAGALDRVEARLAVGSVVDLVASCFAPLLVMCGEQGGVGDWGKSRTNSGG